MTWTRQPHEFIVDLEAYSGPLDLLLSLIRKEEVDILDIPIARITDQYLAELQQMRERQVEISGEFMVLAATLMQIKSRLLLPRPVTITAEDDDDDPRRELVQLLLEYQHYREAADLLSSLAAARQRSFDTPGEQPDLGPRAVGEATLTALMQAYERLLAASVVPESPALRPMVYRVGEQADWLLERLAGGPLPFSALFGERPTRLRVVVTFMALLQLVRDERILAAQDEQYGEIRLQRVDHDRVATA